MWATNVAASGRDGHIPPTGPPGRLKNCSLSACPITHIRLLTDARDVDDVVSIASPWPPQFAIALGARKNLGNSDGPLPKANCGISN